MTWGHAVRELQTLLELRGPAWRVQTRRQLRRAVARALQRRAPAWAECADEPGAQLALSLEQPELEPELAVVVVESGGGALVQWADLELDAQNPRKPLPADVEQRTCPGCGALVSMLETGLLIHHGKHCESFQLAALDHGFERYAFRLDGAAPLPGTLRFDQHPPTARALPPRHPELPPRR